MDALFDAIVHAREHGVEAVLVTVVQADGSTPARAGAKMLVLAGRPPQGTVGGGALEYAAVERAKVLLTARHAELISYSLAEGNQVVEDAVPTGMVCGGNATLFFDYLGLGERVYIYGGGHVGAAVARALAELPYYVTVIDHRAEVAESNEAYADQVLVGDYVTALDDEVVPPGSYFLIATPSHTFDYDVLLHIMESDWQPAYVGMLGSATKAGTLLAELYQTLGDLAPWEALYCPVGLAIGGPTPVEIAISIIAEMQAVRYGQQGHRHMRLPKP